jgi:hypothetical protein
MTTGYETFTGQPWSVLATASPSIADFLFLVFRVYGAYNVAVGIVTIAVAITAFRRGEGWAWWTLLIGNAVAYPGTMAYDRSVGFIGPFEALEYVCLAMIFAGLAVTVPFGARRGWMLGSSGVLSRLSAGSERGS